MKWYNSRVENFLSLITILIVLELLVIAVCVLVVTFYTLKALKSFTNLADSISRMKMIAALPAFAFAIISRIFKKRG